MSESTAVNAQDPHLLYVAFSYPPARSAGMYRALATANAFARNGWRVTVLTATRETFERLTGSDPETEASIDPRITVVRVPFDTARGESDLSRWSRLRVYSPLLWNALRWLIASFGFPERAYASWRHPLARAAERIHAADAVDLVVGSANPNVDFVPGDHLHRKFGVPYVMDHRDAWHLNVYTGKRVGNALSRSFRWERRALKHAVEAWFVNEPIRRWHAKMHPSRAENFHVVANGFDPEFLENTGIRTPDPDRGLVFGYLGTIYGPIPLREALEGWRIARSQSELIARSTLRFRGRLGHFAEPDAAAAALLAEFEGYGVEYGGPVSKTQVAQVYEGYDVLLLIISRSAYVTSGKVFEYAATGLPIAALHHPETAATDVLAGYPLAFPIARVEADEIARALIAAGERAARLTGDEIAQARGWAAKLSRDAQLLPRIASLRAYVRGESR